MDLTVATSSFKAFERHTWYLHGEFNPLALWDDSLTIIERKKIADEFVAQESKVVGRIGAGFGKPDLQTINTDATSLHELVTPASLRFFEILGFENDFLNLPPEDWTENQGYREAEVVLRHMKVTNESAERSVKLCADFLGLSKKRRSVSKQSASG